MRKLSRFILISGMALSLVACGGNKAEENATDAVVNEQQMVDEEQENAQNEEQKEITDVEEQKEDIIKEQETETSTEEQENKTEEKTEIVEEEENKEIEEETTSETTKEEANKTEDKKENNKTESNKTEDKKENNKTESNKQETNKTEGKKPSKKPETDKTEINNKPEKEEVKEEVSNDKEETKEEKEEEPKTEESTTSATMGQTLLADFKARIKKNPSMKPQEMADALLTNGVIQFMSGSMPVEEGWLSGFSADITGFKEGASFGPMMGSIAFIGYIFELEEGSDVEAFIKTLKNNADPRWNICVEAEETVVYNSGNTVFFLMCPRQMESN